MIVSCGLASRGRLTQPCAQPPVFIHTETAEISAGSETMVFGAGRALTIAEVNRNALAEQGLGLPEGPV